ncbi:GH25 family lysozyme [Lacticaseibacillus pabuli]|uniref:GH25 family lysozyme n=1 Tax=Lacticaseibacillus pabuli TaxID=3025672 RepID=A0ABY7WU20_9LACO|nr:GH25 family lysozyme [Lacticaseibacillus sp. KACC 23028]WDF83653.1 GH25 family lysozyme [Lacticaseibacillus sp. KACC 23028]
MSSTRLNFIDIASYQLGMNAGSISADAVIVKATEGTSYVNPGFAKHPQQVLAAGKGLGLYHFARQGTSWQAEADHFLAVVKPYLGKATLWLDWEAGAVKNGTAWAKNWLDYVYRKTGVRPGIYMGLADENAYGWSAVAAAGYPLWVAQYNNYNSVWGFAPRSIYGHVAHKWQWTAFQYTSSGRLSGWAANLDLDVYYGSRTDWDKMAGAKSVTTKGVAGLPQAKLYESRLAGLVYARVKTQVYSTSKLDKASIIKGKYLEAGVTYKAFARDGSVWNLGGDQWVGGPNVIAFENPLTLKGANIRGAIVHTGASVPVYAEDGSSLGQTLPAGNWTAYKVSEGGTQVSVGGPKWLKVYQVGIFM